MKPTRSTLPFLLLLCTLLTGCVQSVQPFLKESQVTFDPKFVGAWTNADGSTRIDVGPSEDGRGYVLATTDSDGKTSRYTAYLGKVQDRLILDVSPADPNLTGSDTYKSFFLPLHSFMLVDTTPPDLRLTPIDYDWFKKYIPAHPDEIAHVMQSPDRPILTASTDDLQAFLLKHLKTPGAYADPLELKRAPAAQPTAK